VVASKKSKSEKIKTTFVKIFSEKMAAQRKRKFVVLTSERRIQGREKLFRAYQTILEHDNEDIDPYLYPTTAAFVLDFQDFKDYLSSEVYAQMINIIDGLQGDGEQQQRRHHQMKITVVDVDLTATTGSNAATTTTAEYNKDDVDDSDGDSDDDSSSNASLLSELSEMGLSVPSIKLQHSRSQQLPERINLNVAAQLYHLETDSFNQNKLSRRQINSQIHSRRP